MKPTEFDLHAELEDHHWWFRARREIIFHLLQQHVSVSKKHRLLEIGCGTGGNLRFLSPHYQTMGIEIDPYAAKLASQRAGCEIRCGDIGSTMHDSSFVPDTVLMLDVLEHVQDERALLKEAFSLLPVGGLLVLTVPADPHLWSQHDVSLGHYRRYTRSTFSALWHELPIQQLYVSHFNSLLYPGVRLARAFSSTKSSGKSDLAPVNPLINTLLYRTFAIERYLLGKILFPWGCSLVAIMRKSSS